jgi:hypothetical protein
MAKATQQQVKQAQLNAAAKEALQTLDALKRVCERDLQPLMWVYEFKALSTALQLVRQLLKNQLIADRGRLSDGAGD